MPSVLVVPVNPKRITVISTDTRICENVRFSFVCCFEKRKNILILFLKQQLNFDSLDVAVI